MKFGGIVQWVRNQPGEGKLATPEASLATAKVTTPAMRRHANMGAAACSLEMTHPEVQGLVRPEDNSSATVKESEPGGAQRRGIWPRRL
jgi:hypothetical protein